MQRYSFMIPIGDWSGDGHSRVEMFSASAAKPIVEVREAYFNAVQDLPTEVCPENFCESYGDSEVPEETVVSARDLGFTIDPKNFGPKEMAKFVAWFVNQGDPEVDVRLEKRGADMLAFYGVDDKKRRINFIGYGLFQ